MFGSKVTASLLEGEFCVVVELNQEGSEPAACAAGLFKLKIHFLHSFQNLKKTVSWLFLWLCKEGSAKGHFFKGLELSTVGSVTSGATLSRFDFP